MSKKKKPETELDTYKGALKRIRRLMNEVTCEKLFKFDEKLYSAALAAFDISAGPRGEYGYADEALDVLLFPDGSACVNFGNHKYSCQNYAELVCLLAAAGYHPLWNVRAGD